MASDIDLVLRDVPELGYFAHDGVGEVLVRKKLSELRLLDRLGQPGDTHPGYVLKYTYQ